MNNGKDNGLKAHIEACYSRHTLPPGSRERFMAQLRQHQRKQLSRRRVWYAAGTASLVAASLLAAALILTPPEREHTPGEMEITMAEVKGYYASLFMEETEFICDLIKDMPSQTREELMEEVARINQSPDSTIDFIMKEGMSDGEKILYATRVYKSHLHSLQHIRGILSSHKQANLTKPQKQ